MIMLIDASGFIYRAFHAYPPLTRPDGTPFGAVYGFASMLINMLTESDCAIAVVFDHASKTFRNDIYPAYKANRPPTPDDLAVQQPLIREAASIMGLTAVSVEGFEADDLIATYAAQATDAGADVVIVSSDKDLMQLVSHSVAMFDPMKKMTIGPDEVFEKFGVYPDRVIDVQALAGDAVDNIPGVEGIGTKIAAELINTYGDLDGVLENARSITQKKRRANLMSQADNARLSRQLVTLRTDVPVTVPIDTFGGFDPDIEAVTEFLKVQQPDPGFYEASLAKGAPVVGVLIEESGDVLANGGPVDTLKIWVARFEPITEAKYKYLIADRAWAKQYEPDSAEANPFKPVVKTPKAKAEKPALPEINIRDLPIQSFMP